MIRGLTIRVSWESQLAQIGHGGFHAVRREPAVFCGKWRRGVLVTALAVSTKLLYIRRARLVPGWVTVFGRANNIDM